MARSLGPRRRRISRETKERWFSRGVSALVSVLPSASGKGYCCPLCLRASTSLDAFTGEDVPPRHQAGRPLVLTCKECNDRGGSELDWHWANAAAIDGFLRGEMSQPLRARFSHEGAEVAIDASRVEGVLQFYVVPSASNPSHVLALQASAKDIGPNTTFKLRLPEQRYSEQCVQLSVLRAGYLAAFAVYGYRFFSVWEAVRVQLSHGRAPDELVTRLVRYEQDAPAGRRLLAFVYEPREMPAS